MEYRLICGLFFGTAIDVVMRFIVLPLSRLHARGPYQYHDLVLGLVVHNALTESQLVPNSGQFTPP